MSGYHGNVTKETRAPDHGTIIIHMKKINTFFAEIHVRYNQTYLSGSRHIATQQVGGVQIYTTG